MSNIIKESTLNLTGQYSTIDQIRSGIYDPYANSSDMVKIYKWHLDNEHYEYLADAAAEQIFGRRDSNFKPVDRGNTALLRKRIPELEQLLSERGINTVIMDEQNDNTSKTGEQ